MQLGQKLPIPYHMLESIEGLARAMVHSREQKLSGY